MLNTAIFQKMTPSVTTKTPRQGISITQKSDLNSCAQCEQRPPISFEATPVISTQDQTGNAKCDQQSCRQRLLLGLLPWQTASCLARHDEAIRMRVLLNTGDEVIDQSSALLARVVPNEEMLVEWRRMRMKDFGGQYIAGLTWIVYGGAIGLNIRLPVRFSS